MMEAATVVVERVFVLSSSAPRQALCCQVYKVYDWYMIEGCLFHATYIILVI